MSKKNNTVTAKDVAAVAGVSQTTVSMILNNYENVSFSEETRNKVLAACVTTGYRGISKENNKPTENMILVVCPSCENLDYSRSLRAIQERCNELGYISFTLFTHRETTIENSILSYLKSMPFAGVIFLYLPQNIYLVSQISKIYPTFAVCDHVEGFDLDSVELNSLKVGKVIANHLLELGHKNIAYVAMNISEKYTTRMKRLEGIQEAYIQYGYDKSCIHLCTYDTERITPPKFSNEFEAGFILANRVIDRLPDITAFVGNNDMICYGIISALQKRKFKIPQDYSVIGCDNVILSSLQSISLSTVEHYGNLRAIDAVNMLIKKIQSAESNNYDLPNSFTRVEYEPKLIQRSSTNDASYLRHPNKVK